MNENGNFMITWITRQPYEAFSLLLIQVYGADGNPLGGDFVVNTTTEGPQATPRLAMTSDSRVVVTWTGPDAGQPADADVFAQVFVPLTPQGQIDALIDDINALIAAGDLASNRAAPLISRLESAADKLDAGQTQAACSQLGAFINQVYAYIKSRTLTVAEGQSLIDAAQSIRTNLGC